MTQLAALLSRPNVRQVLAALAQAGINGRLVGGCVRDALLGRNVHDIDIAADAPPDALVAGLVAAGLRYAPTGLQHGTVTVLFPDDPIELTALRRDVKTDGRHAVVAFTTDWALDAARRDLTMNALYLSADGHVHDPTGQGLADLRAGRVRFIGDPDQRLAEDALRLLRFFRFHAHYGMGAPDAAGLAACARAVPLLARLSRERIRAELLRLLAAPDPYPSLEAMAAIGALTALHPGFELSGLALVLQAEVQLGRAPDPLLRLLALLPVLPPDFAQQLRLSRAEWLALVQADAARRSPDPPLALGFRFGVVAAQRGLLLRGMTDAAAHARAAQGAATRFPLDGAALIAAGLSPGPHLGRVLAQLQARWLANDQKDSAATLLASMDSNP